jgi:hypothetical protein
MRRNKVSGFFAVFAVFGLIFCLLACKAASNQAADTNDGQDEMILSEDESQEAGALVNSGGGPSNWHGPVGVVIASTAYFWEFTDGIMSPVNTVRYAGDMVGWKDEYKEKVARKGYTDPRNFYRVDLDGEDLWVQEYAIAGPGAVPGVIVGDDTVLYTRPDLTALASWGLLSLPHYTIVAVFPEMDAEQFTGISAYLDNGGPVKQLYVKRQNVTTDPSDVKAMQLYQLAMATTIGIRRRELLKNALEISSSFNFFISQAMEELEGYTSISERFAVTEDNVNIRDRPDVDGEKTGSLSKDTVVTAQGRSNSRWQAAGKTDYWYLIDNGWVFGAFLKKYETQAEPRAEPASQ